jgi:8-oxo-dGTP diphosphatase
VFPITAVRDVYMIVRDADRVLLLFRSGTGYKDGEWSLPAGKVEAGETYTAGAVRELAEEVGIEIDASHLRPVHVMERVESGGDPWVGVYFDVTADATPINSEPDKHSAMEWFSLDALPQPMVAYAAHALAAIARGEVFSEWSE